MGGGLKGRYKSWTLDWTLDWTMDWTVDVECRSLRIGMSSGMIMK